jgi:hypothetical protein
MDDVDEIKIDSFNFGSRCETKFKVITPCPITWQFPIELLVCTAHVDSFSQYPI